MENLFAVDGNSTLLSEEDKHDLKLKWITTRAELNELETQGVINAEKWLLKNKKDILSEEFIKKLHKKIFKDIWKWAGKFRTIEVNLGVAPYRIQENLRLLLDDIKFWIGNKIYPIKEIAIRFHHRLVSIHPFHNGNGRISRLMADLLMESFNLPALTWGPDTLTEVSKLRKKYIDALQEADKGNYKNLIQFIEDNEKTSK